MCSIHSFFATVPMGMQLLLSQELKILGAQHIEESRAGAGFQGSMELAYRVCLWSRTASRVLLPLATFPVASFEELYHAIRSMVWEEHLGPQNSLAVDFVSSESAFGHTHFGAQKTKDAIVDRLRTPSGARPSVNTEEPDVRINVYIRNNQATVSIDLSGHSLHRRGWRKEVGLAPLKENLAAGILYLADWPKVASEGGGVIDPLCGSGTLPIEAALMAADVAPGLMRERWGFSQWRGHQLPLWKSLHQEAMERDGRNKQRPPHFPPIIGYDLDPSAVRMALMNIERAGLRGFVHCERREITAVEPVGDRPGIWIANPPYGQRLGETDKLSFLYRQIGDSLKQRFTGWKGYLFTANRELAKHIGLKIARKHVLFNGSLECRLLEIPIHAGSISPPKKPRVFSPAAQAFANRLRKNIKHLSKWAKREKVTCFRVYDADLPEYALAVDLYEQCVHVQEYERPPEIEAVKAEQRLHDALALIPQILEVRPSDVFLKVRRRQRHASQYEKLAEQHDYRVVQEGEYRFWVNLTDRLDTGLFLDHRLMRKRVGELAQGKKFLNLFAYTGTATVYAAKGGAVRTTTVDLSKTYLDWARRNFELNHLSESRHELIRADVLEWINQEKRRWDLIFCDPPTFSRSKNMRGTFDVQRDYHSLLRSVATLLEPQGILLFSNNLRRFKMDVTALPGLEVKEITRSVLPPDFARSPKIHNAWQITFCNCT